MAAAVVFFVICGFLADRLRARERDMIRAFYTEPACRTAKRLAIDDLSTGDSSSHPVESMIVRWSGVTARTETNPGRKKP